MATGENTPAIQSRIVVTATWTDMPRAVIDEVRELWALREFGNDYYYCNVSSEDIDDWKADGTYPNLTAYLEENIPDFPKDGILLHFWW